MTDKVTVSKDGYKYFKKLDRSGNGHLEAKELRKAADKLGNNDGNTTVEEAAKLREHLKNYINDEKVLDKMASAALGTAKVDIEFVQGKTLDVNSSRFDRFKRAYDLDQDGRVTTHELIDYADSRSGNSPDGKISIEEAARLEEDLFIDLGDPKLATKLATEALNNEDKSYFYKEVAEKLTHFKFDGKDSFYHQLSSNPLALDGDPPVGPHLLEATDSTKQVAVILDPPSEGLWFLGNRGAGMMLSERGEKVTFTHPVTNKITEGWQLRLSSGQKLLIPADAKFKVSIDDLHNNKRYFFDPESGQLKE